MLTVLVAAVAAAALAVSGCGETVIDQAKVEATIKENLRDARHERVASVDCPSGVEVQPGATFKCTVSLVGGGAETATLRIVDKKADLEMTGLSGGK